MDDITIKSEAKLIERRSVTPHDNKTEKSHIDKSKPIHKLQHIVRKKILR